MDADKAEFIDPVCGMTVRPEGPHRLDYKGRTYRFCCAGCLERFEGDPEKYLNRSEEAGWKPAPQRPSMGGPDASGGPGVYTCPMHPQVRRPGPAACPKCGMDLEPESGVAPEEGPELAAMTRRFRIALLLTAPVAAAGMSHMLPGHPLQRILSPNALNWAQLILSTPVVVWAGRLFFQRAWQSILARSLNMFTLIAGGVGVAYGYSLVATVAPRIFPASFQEPGGGVGVYFEAAAVITTLVLLGQMLELRARARTGGAIRALLDLAPKTARRLSADGGEQDVPLADVRPGDRLRVRPGDRVPVDGVILDGSAAIDESMMTGEPIPVEKRENDKAVGGTVSRAGSFIMRAERVGDQTLLARIVEMVRQAQRSRAPIQRQADRIAAWFVPAVILTSALTFAAWAILGPRPAMAYAVLNAVAVLIIACPCALGLATPMSIMVATGRGASEGILVKNAEAIEVLEKVNTLVVDKTGTLTEGKPRLIAVRPSGDWNEKDLLRLAASLERASEHPLAEAVVRGAEERGVPLAEVRNFVSRTGKGVAGEVDGRRVVLGNRAMLEDVGAGGADLLHAAEESRRQGRTVLFAVVDGAVAGLLEVEDPVKESTPEALRALRREGVEVVMVTGDTRAAAEAIGRPLSIDRIEAEVLPERKAEMIRRLQSEGRIVAMAGDGVNDAPALAQAHVGIAMGPGAEIAMESAGITLVRGDLRAIARARRLSRATMRNIRQNLFFALAYNALGIPVAAGVLYPVFGLLLNPIIAGAAMSCSSLSVIANALRLRRVSIR